MTYKPLHVGKVLAWPLDGFRHRACSTRILSIAAPPGI